MKRERLTSWYFQGWDAWRAEDLGHMEDLGEETKAVDADRDEMTTTLKTESRGFCTFVIVKGCSVQSFDNLSSHSGLRTPGLKGGCSLLLFASSFHFSSST